jgi:hypothetical protein
MWTSIHLMLLWMLSPGLWSWISLGLVLTVQEDSISLVPLGSQFRQIILQLIKVMYGPRQTSNMWWTIILWFMPFFCSETVACLALWKAQKLIIYVTDVGFEDFMAVDICSVYLLVMMLYSGRWAQILQIKILPVLPWRWRQSVYLKHLIRLCISITDGMLSFLCCFWTCLLCSWKNMWRDMLRK